MNRCDINVELWMLATHDMDLKSWGDVGGFQTIGDLFSKPSLIFDVMLNAYSDYSSAKEDADDWNEEHQHPADPERVRPVKARVMISISANEEDLENV